MFKHVRASPNKVDECTVFFEQKWASVKYCDRLDKTGTDAGNQFDCDIYAYLDVAAPTNDRYPQVIDLDVKPGTYIIIGHGSVVFTPYSGKPDLGFK